MTATILEPTAVETPQPAEDDFGHIICHCTGANIAWCGLDVTGHMIESGELDIDEACPLCVLACDMLTEAGTCPWGCSCSNLTNQFFCGDYIDEETTHDHHPH